MPSIDVILIVVAGLVGVIGVALSFWDDICIWWFEFQYGKMDHEMAMQMCHWYEEEAESIANVNASLKTHSLRKAQEYEMYATRIIERAERRAK